MYSRLQLASRYFGYCLTAANGRGHGIHSPFVYDLVRNVLRDKTNYASYAAVEGLREKLLRDGTLLEVEDLGAGPAKGRTSTRSVGEIARHAAKPRRLGQLLFRLARYYRPAVVVELGASLGLSAAYLAAGMKGAGELKNEAMDSRGLSGRKGAEEAGFWTIEGSASIAARAKVHLTGLGLTNVHVTIGNFDEKLGPLLERVGPVELAFVDGNHREEPTLRYFESLLRHSGPAAMLIFDDIHWSRGMEQAWAQIRADPRVLLTIDLFFFGMVIIRDEFKVKQDYRIRF